MNIYCYILEYIDDMFCFFIHDHTIFQYVAIAFSLFSTFILWMLSFCDIIILIHALNLHTMESKNIRNLLTQTTTKHEKKKLKNKLNNHNRTEYVGTFQYKCYRIFNSNIKVRFNREHRAHDSFYDQNRCNWSNIAWL